MGIAKREFELLACASKHRHIVIQALQVTLENEWIEITLDRVSPTYSEYWQASAKRQFVSPPADKIAMYLCCSIHLPPTILATNY